MSSDKSPKSRVSSDKPLGRRMSRDRSPRRRQSRDRSLRRRQSRDRSPRRRQSRDNSSRHRHSRDRSLRRRQSRDRSPRRRQSRDRSPRRRQSRERSSRRRESREKVSLNRSYSTRDSRNTSPSSSKFTNSSETPRETPSIPEKTSKMPKVHPILKRILKGNSGKCNVFFEYQDKRVLLDQQTDFEALAKQAAFNNVNFLIQPTTQGAAFNNLVSGSIFKHLLAKRRNNKTFVKFQNENELENPRQEVTAIVYKEIIAGKKKLVRAILLRRKTTGVLLNQKEMNVENTRLARHNEIERHKKKEWEVIQAEKDPRKRRWQEDIHRENYEIPTPKTVLQAFQDNKKDNEVISPKNATVAAIVAAKFKTLF